jgi:hypothetical protein
VSESELKVCQACKCPGRYESVSANDLRWWKVACDTAGCPGTKYIKLHSTKREAATTWNRRRGGKAGMMAAELKTAAS